MNHGLFLPMKTGYTLRSAALFALLIMLSAISCTKQSDQNLPDPWESHRTTITLPNGTVNCILEDRCGYMWFGTARGVLRYDGESYRQYVYDKDHANTLPSNYVITLFEDMGGTLWAGTIEGVARLNERDEFVPVRYDHGDIWSQSIHQFIQTSDGRLFISTADMIEEYDAQQDEFVRRMFFDNGKATRAVAFDTEDRLWYLSEGIVRVREDVSATGQADTLSIAGQDVRLMTMLPNSVLCCMNNKHLTIWSTDLHMLLYQESAAQLVGRWGFSADDVTALMPGEGSSVYIFTRNRKVFLLDYSTRSIKEVGVPSGAKTVYTDSHNNVWFGTEKTGFQMRPETDMMNMTGTGLRYAYNGVSIDNLSKSKNGDILVNTTSDGLYLFSTAERTIRRLSYEPFTSIQPTAVYLDSSDRLWVSTPGRCYVFRMSHSIASNSGSGGPETVVLRQLFSFETEQGEMFLEDRDGNVWLTTRSHYLYVLPAGKTMLESIRLNVESGYMFMPEIYQTESGKIRLLAFHYGVYDVDIQTHEVTHVVNLLGKLHSNFLPTCMTEDSDGQLWIGTETEGVFICDTSTGEMTHVDEIECEYIYSLLEGPGKVIWAGTANGLYRYERESGAVVLFSRKDAFIQGDLSSHSTLLFDDGTLLLGSTGGLILVNPRDIEWKNDVRLYFDDLYVDGVMISPSEGGIIDRDLRYHPEVILKKGTGSVGFSFSSPSFQKGRPVDYLYRLVSYDPNWQMVRFDRMVQYSHLPEGRYRLELEARDGISGDWLQSAMVDIRVTSPLLTSRLMRRMVYPLLGLVLMMFIVQGYLRSKKNEREKLRITQEKENEENLNKMNVSFFTNMSHEFRTPLTLISGPMDEIAEALPDTPYNRGLVTTVRHSVNRMLKLVDQIMDFSKLETDALNLSLCECDAAGVFRSVASSFQYNCNRKGIRLEINDSCDARTAFLDTDKFEKILNNLLSNAVKYTPGGPDAIIRASLEIVPKEQAVGLFREEVKAESDEFLLLSVCDTGLGVPEDMREEIFERYRRLSLDGRNKEYGSGIGLYYTRRLAVLHHGLVEADASPYGKGSCFRLLLPMSEMEYQGEIFVSGTPANIRENSLDVMESQCSSNDSKAVVLLVEDDVDVASYISSLLGKYYDVRVKFSADDAYSDIRFQSPDLVITDVMVPGEMDGLGLCKALKEKMETCHIPVMVLSAKSTLDDQIRGIESGADSYVTKPVAPSYLLTLTKTLLANREKLRSRIQETTDVAEIVGDSLSPQDRYFLESLYQVMENQLGSSELNVDMVADSLKISRAKLYYKFKGLMNETPNSFFKKYKLNRAAELLRSGKYNVSEVSDMTGFSSLSYFSVSFKKQFGVKPSDYS